MKKSISNKLFLLALCMQYGAGKVVAEQGSLVITQIQPLSASDLKGRFSRCMAHWNNQRV